MQTAPPLNHNVSVPDAASSKATASKPSPPPAVSRAQGIALPGAAEIAARKAKSTTPLQAVNVETRAAGTTEPKPEADKSKESSAAHPAIDHLSAPASRIQSGTVTPVVSEEKKEPAEISPAQEPADAAAATEKHRGSDVVEASVEDIKKIESENSITESKEEDQKDEDNTVQDATAKVQALSVEDKSTTEEKPVSVKETAPGDDKTASKKEDTAPEQEKSTEETSSESQKESDAEQRATEEKAA